MVLLKEVIHLCHAVLPTLILSFTSQSLVFFLDSWFLEPGNHMAISIFIKTVHSVDLAVAKSLMHASLPLPSYPQTSGARRQDVLLKKNGKRMGSSTHADTLGSGSSRVNYSRIN